MKPYVDSYNYAEIASAIASSIQQDNDNTEAFFIELKYQLENVLEKVKDAYSVRQSYFEASDYDWDNPEELPDFMNSPEAVAEDNYDAWDHYCDCKEVYDEDTRIMSRIIDRVNKAIDLIGGLE